MTKCSNVISPTTVPPTTSPTTTNVPPTTIPPIVQNLKIVNQYPTGIVGDVNYQFDAPRSTYPPTGEIWENISVKFKDNNKLSIIVDDRGWAFQNQPLFKIELSDKWLSKDELENIDFSNQKGNDILIYVGNYFNNKIKIGWTFVHIKGDSSTNLPQYVTRLPNKRMPQFFRNYPSITMPDSKINILQFHQLDEDGEHVSEKYFDKGWTIAKSSEKSKSFYSEYDEWCYSRGGKRHDGYTPIDGFKTNQEFNINWINKNSIQDLYQWFKSDVINPAKGYKFGFLDWEAWGYVTDNQDFIDKVGTLFREFYKENGYKLTTYINSKPFDCNYSRNISSEERDIQNAKYQKSLKEISTGFFSKTCKYLDVHTGTFTGESENMGTYLFSVVGDYLHQVNYSLLYSIIQEFELCAKNNIDAISLNWGLNEMVESSDYTTFERAFRKNDGFEYLHETKPPTPPSYMWNIALISNFMGKGTWWWDEPLPFEEGYEHYGSSSKPLSNDGYLPNDFGKNLGSFHYTSQIGFDYVVRAFYKLQFNQEFLLDVKNIYAPTYSIDGATKSGDMLLPASAEFYKLPIVRCKKHPYKNEWLILAVNHHLNHYDKQIVKVIIDGKEISLELNGQFATCERISL